MIWLTRNFDEHNYNVVPARVQEVNPHREALLGWETRGLQWGEGRQTILRTNVLARARMSWTPPITPTVSEAIHSPEVSTAQAAGGRQESFL